MYTRDFWDTVYLQHFDDAPWMSEEWARHGTDIIEKYIDVCSDDLILDYGCGNALISEYFLKQGAQIELAEISDKMITWLDNHFDHRVKIYNVKMPNEIRHRNRFDYVIAWGVFHHIKPDLWVEFLNGFYNLMKNDALLFISGWNDNDEIIINDNKTARFTGKPVWFINNLVGQVSHEKFDIVSNQVSNVKLPAFNSQRSVRSLVLRKK